MAIINNNNNLKMASGRLSQNGGVNDDACRCYSCYSYVGRRKTYMLAVLLLLVCLVLPFYIRTGVNEMSLLRNFVKGDSTAPFVVSSKAAAAAPVVAEVEVLPTKCLPVYDTVTNTFVSVEIIQNHSTAACLLDTPPSDYIQLMILTMVGTPLAGSYWSMKDLGRNRIRPYHEPMRQLGEDWPPFGYTMIGKARMRNLQCALAEVNRNQIPGAVVELGVWRGGAMMLAAAIGKESSESNNNNNIIAKRDVYLLDAFEAIGEYPHPSLQTFLATKMEDVQGYFQYFGLDGPHIHYVKGLFNDTLPHFVNEKHHANNNSITSIAVLRVDGNFYESYEDAMYYLYDKVPVGGIVIFDDVLSHPRVMQFWNDFQVEQRLSEELHNIDRHSAWFRKEKDITIDWSYFRRPRGDANITKAAIRR